MSMRAQSEAQDDRARTDEAWSGGRSGASRLRGGLERLTDLLAVLLVCCPLDLELRTVRARSCVQHRSVVGRVRCPLRGAVQQGAQASFLSHRVARRASRGAAGGWLPRRMTGDLTGDSFRICLRRLSPLHEVRKCVSNFSLNSVMLPGSLV